VDPDHRDRQQNEYQNSFSDVSMLRYRPALEAWARLLREG